jgi:hypothetical protein
MFESRVLVAATCATLFAVTSPAQAQGEKFAVGEKVLLEASKHWIPCTVAEAWSENSAMRVDCPAYPALSRSAGRYIVHDLTPAGIRKAAEGAPVAAAQAPRAAPARASSTPANGGGGLKVGEYACYGAGGRPMAGLGFKVLAGGRYTDLDGGNAGTYSVAGGNITFAGGHMASVSGRDFNAANGTFRVGAQALCEPW